MSIKPIPRLMFFTLVAFAFMLAAFTTVTLSDSPVVRLVTMLVALVVTGFMLVLVARVVFSEQGRTTLSPLPCPEHLRVKESERGFAGFPSLPNRYGGPEDISVYEASNAEYAGIWLNVKGMGSRGQHVEVTANVTAETAWRLAEQLAVLVANHYQGDQRPADEETILSVDTERLDTRDSVSHV